MTEPVPLPSGAVTLLFTDIERSSEKWDHHPDLMARALARHDEILKAAIAGHGGAIVKHKGDGFFAAFQSAAEAVDAVVESQHGVAASEWPSEIGPLRVRMALHTGLLEPDGEDYHGPEVNKVARLEGVAHGGQTLLSSTTASDLSDVLPTGVGLEDLGSYRLRSLARPDHIFQLTAPGLEQSFPPLRTEAFDRRALPSYRTSFVGRDREILEMTDLLARADCRLLTLVGPGGTGKTRLAVEGVGRLAAGRSHGAAFVPLATVREVSEVIPAIAGALDFTFDLHGLAMIDHQTQLLDFLATQDILLVLDNFEHVMTAAGLVAELIRETPGVDVVVTSRQRLAVDGEWVLELGGMDLDAGPEAGGRSSALELFLERARQADPGFEAGSDDLEQLGRICGLVQGIPLGIELAAPWVTVLSCAEIADEIDRSLDFLEGTGGDPGHRHHSLRAVFDSSWNLLSDPQRTAFRRLSVFPAPFSREAAEAIAATSVRTLMELRSRSLLRQTSDGTLQLHPLLRQFASELVSPAESEELDSLHGRFYVDRLLVREPDLRGGSRQLDVVAELADEQENLRLAVEWAVANLSSSQVVDVLGAVHQFYLNHGWHEGREAFARLLGLLGATAEDGGSVPLQLPSLWAAAYLSVYEAALAQVEAGEALVDRVLPEWEQLGGIGLATCRYSQGVLAAERGDYPAAREHLAAALEGARLADDAVLIGTTLLWFGWVITELGDPEAGKQLFGECLAVMSVPTNHWGKAFALSKLGVAADGVGEHEQAAEFHHESREMFVKTNDLAGQAYTLSRLSVTYWMMGEYERSRASGSEGLALFEQVNHRWG